MKLFIIFVIFVGAITLSVIIGSFIGIIAGDRLIKAGNITEGAVLHIVPVLILAVYGIVVAVIFKEIKTARDR